jgi:hypothetical protein
MKGQKDRSMVEGTTVCVCVAESMSEVNHYRLCLLLFRFGGLITLFHCSIPVQGSQDEHSIREGSKKDCLCNSSSSNPLRFVFYVIVALSYLPWARISAPRRSSTTRCTALADDARGAQDLLVRFF